MPSYFRPLAQGSPLEPADWPVAHDLASVEPTHLQPAHAVRGITVALTMLVLAVMVPLALLSSVDGLRWNSDTVGAIALTIYASYRLAELLSGGRFLPIELSFFLYVYVFLGLAPTLQMATGAFPWGGTYTSATIWKSYGVLALGLLAYEAGLRSPLIPRAAARLIGARQVSFARSSLVAVFAVSIAGTIAYFVGYEGLFLSRAEHSRALAALAPGRNDIAVQMLADVALRVPIFAVNVAMAAFVCLRRSPGVPAMAAAIAITVLNLVINNPVSSPRAWFGAVLLSLVLIALRRLRRRLASLAYASLVLTLLLVIFPYADAFRYASHIDDVQFDYMSVGGQLSQNGDYSSFQQLMNAVLYTEGQGFTMGRQFAGALLVWLPRSVWPDKPVDTAELVATFHNYEYTNVEMPLWAEFFVDGWMIAVAAGFLVLGLVTRDLDAAFNETGTGDGIPLAYALVPLAAAYEPLLVRGDLMSTLSWLLVLAALLWMQSYVPRLRPIRRVVGR